MKPQQIFYKNSILNYYCYGKGSKPVICFHGYGEEAISFHFLEKYADNQYTFFAIDLPFHGKTEWKDGLNFTIDDLLQITRKILNKDNFNPDTFPDKISLLGFSLGGRVALSLYQAMPERIEKIVLLAPDGLKVNFWYWLCTQVWAGNQFFAFTMKHPGWFFRLLKLLNKLRLVNASIFRFVNFYIGNKNVRQLLYRRWTSLRKLKPDLEKIKLHVLKNKTPVRLVYGKYDRIILSSVGEKFKKGIEEYCTLSVIESGHQLLHEKHAGAIMESLLS